MSIDAGFSVPKRSSSKGETVIDAWTVATADCADGRLAILLGLDEPCRIILPVEYHCSDESQIYVITDW